MRHRHRLSTLAAAAWLWLAAVPLLAQPAVTNVTRQGSSLVISGTAFGTHANYGAGQPFLNAGFHNFENGSFFGGNMELENDGANQWSLQQSNNRANSRFHAQKVYINTRLGEYGLFENRGGMRGSTGTFFVSFWMRLPGLLGGTIDSKFFRIYGANTENLYLHTGNGDLMLKGFSTCSSCSPAPTSVWGTPNSFQANVWHRVDVQIRDRSQGSADYISAFLDNVRQFQRGGTLPSRHIELEGSLSNKREQWVPTALRGDGHTVAVGQMIEPGSGNFRFDDVYVDYTWARVELGNAATLAGSTIREIQLPTRWSNTDIAVLYNPGAFTSGQTAYVYVFDANGTANANGYPVVISGASGVNGITATPPTPTNPRIIH